MRLRGLALLTLTLLFALSFTTVLVYASFTVTTDKSSYRLGEVMTITVSGATPNGKVMLQLNGPTGPMWVWEDVASSDGTLTMQLKVPSDWPTGDYTLYAKDVSTGSVSTCTFTVSAPPPVVSSVELTANIRMIYVGDVVAFTAVVYDQYGDPMANVEVKLYIDGELYGARNSSYDGTVTFYVTFDEAGVFEVYAVADGVQSNTVDITVREPPAVHSILLDAETTEVDVGGVVIFTATVRDQYGSPMAGVQVDLMVDGELYDTKYAGIGGAAVFLVRFDVEGAHEVYAIADSVKSNTITVTVSPLPPAPTVTSISLEVDKESAVTGEPVTFRATVHDQNGNPMSSVSVTLYINDELYSIRTTDANGVASFTVTFGEAGSYTARAVADNVQSNSVTINVSSRPPPPPPATLYVVAALIVIIIVIVLLQYMRRRY